MLCSYIFFMFQKEELQDVILFAIKAARGRGACGRRGRGRGRGRGKRWRGGLLIFIIIIKIINFITSFTYIKKLYI